MTSLVRSFTLLPIFLLPMNLSYAGWSDWLDVLKSGETEDQAIGTSTGVTALTQNEMVKGLKEALDQGISQAVKQLGREGGFLNNAAVRIPMPESLTWVETSMRKLKQDQLADDFILSMNRAAEQAVPEVASVFHDAIRAMTLKDAQSLLQGPDNAATEYFRKHSSAKLQQKILPIVREATDNTGVTSYYKKVMTSSGSMLGNWMKPETTDLDGYVTEKAMDGLFLVIAEEEKRIRENPLKRSSEILQKVFSAYSK